MKKKKTYSKHDLRRSIEDIEKAVYFMSERMRRFEVVFNDYVEMQKNEDKFKEFGKPGETISDFIKRAPLDELIKLELQGGGKVISISDYLKQKEKPKIKKIDLAQGDFNKTVAGLSDSDKALIKDLLRKSGVLVGD